jgi:hypothetical protein
MLRKLTITLLCVSLASQLIEAKPGPVAGAVAYWATKTLCYGTAAAATSAIIVGTGGLAGAASTGFAAATVASGGATAAVGVAGATIAGAGLASEAAVATVAVAQATGGLTAIGSTIAAVETASTTMGTIFTLIPWLP